ncbi:hypothetical protein BSY238_2838 [Methyloversatilis sp. RAC08]|uniref:hypothetical protein n=1 Tax=Methyloversatilis sp. RAC08 TaxID=1842540 RepID=UPI00083DBD50|nr:hypothetical protein [Methyloversatilis sp. RAC08]AOF81346.1 hypothetical protein BSY238_2838 [Methyloversatilis sp. RAC08]
MAPLFGAQHRTLQDQSDIRAEHPGFIESRDFFFLTTIEQCSDLTVSHTGGSPGCETPSATAKRIDGLQGRT